MIGKLHITEQTFAVLNEDGVWECPHAGYEAELNALHYPRPDSPDILLPFGHMALHKAAAAYKGSYELTNGAVPILDLVPPRRPMTSEVVAELRQELARQEASGDISPEDAAEARRLLEEAASEALAASTKRFRAHLWRRKAIAYGVKGKVQKPSGRWWDDEKNTWTTPPGTEEGAPRKRSRKPKDSAKKPVPQSYNTDGDEPSSSSTGGGKKVRKPKAASAEISDRVKDIYERADDTSVQRAEVEEALDAINSLSGRELEQLARDIGSTQTGKKSRAQWIDVIRNKVVNAIAISQRAALDWGQGTGERHETKPKAEPASVVAPDGRVVNPKFEKVDRAVSMLREGMGVGPDADLAISALADMQEEGAEIPGADFNIRERVAADDGFARGAARQILENVAAGAYRKTSYDLRQKEWTYADIKQDLEDRTGGSYSIRWDDEDEYRLGRALEALGWDVTWRGKGAPEPEGEMQTVWPDLSGSGNLFAQVVRPKGSVPLATDLDGGVWTGVFPDREAYQRLRFVLSKAVTATKTRLSNEYAPSHEFMRSVMRLAPDTAPADVWAALLYMEREGAVEFRPLVELTTIGEPRTAAGLPEEDANLWRRGEAQAVNVWMILDNMPDTE